MLVRGWLSSQIVSVLGVVQHGRLLGWQQRSFCKYQTIETDWLDQSSFGASTIMKYLPFTSSDGNWGSDRSNWCKTSSLQSDAWADEVWCWEDGWCSNTLRQCDGLWLNGPWWNTQWRQAQWRISQRWQSPWVQAQRWDWHQTSTGTESQSQHDYNWCELQMKSKRNNLI